MWAQRKHSVFGTWWGASAIHDTRQWLWSSEFHGGWNRHRCWKEHHNNLLLQTLPYVIWQVFLAFHLDVKQLEVVKRGETKRGTIINFLYWGIFNTRLKLEKEGHSRRIGRTIGNPDASWPVSEFLLGKTNRAAFLRSSDHGKKVRLTQLCYVSVTLFNVVIIASIRYN